MKINYVARPGGVVVLTNNINALSLFYWISEREKTYLISSRIDVKLIEKLHPKLVVSYNYVHIIPANIIELLPHRIINLHISFLPYNRGFAPNFWSFWENTKKGVTIHEIDEGLDTGAIISQKELFFDERKETLATSYDKLQEEIVKLFKENWQKILKGDYETFLPKIKGTYHSKKNLRDFLNGRTLDYNELIVNLKRQFGGK